MSPARYGEVLTIRSKVAWVREKTFRVEHEISVDARLCSTGFEVRSFAAIVHAYGPSSGSGDSVISLAAR